VTETWDFSGVPVREQLWLAVNSNIAGISHESAEWNCITLTAKPLHLEFVNIHVNCYVKITVNWQVAMPVCC